MENEKKSLVEWVKEHKKELVIAGISVTMLIALIFALKNKNEVKKMANLLLKLLGIKSQKKMLEEAPVCVERSVITKVSEVSIEKVSKIPHDVSKHLRNLPQGWQASPEKIATAAEYGFVLLPGQTWVNTYSTGKSAA